MECFDAVSTERGVGRVTTFNTGLLYWLTDNLQLNAGVDIGLTAGADDWFFRNYSGLRLFSPSPRPSPPGRGRLCRSVLKGPTLLSLLPR